MSVFVQRINYLQSTIKSFQLLKPAYFILSLYYLYHFKHGGRYSIAKELGIKESRTRIILSTLKKDGLITYGTTSKGRKGVQLTSEGLTFCKELFKVIYILNYEKSWDLEGLTVGKINSVVAIPIDYINTSSIDVINLRDIALQNGALGATIFKGYWHNNEFELQFYDTSAEDIQLEKKLITALKKLSLKIELILNKENSSQDSLDYLIIAGSSSEEPIRYLEMQFFEIYDPLKIALIAAIQGCFSLLSQNIPINNHY